MSKQMLSHAMKSIKRSLVHAYWWKYVQDDIKTQLEKIIDKLDVLGLEFKDAFMSMFRYEHMRRLSEGIAINKHKTSPLFGKFMPEEYYCSGSRPTRMVLDLHEWTKPNDADVYACLHICKHIQALEYVGAFSRTSKFKIDTNKILRDISSTSDEYDPFNLLGDKPDKP